LTIAYGFHPTPFGECLIAVTSRGICHLSFIEQNQRRDHLRNLKQTWLNASFKKDFKNTSSLVRKIFSQSPKTSTKPFNLLLKGTNFQINIWRALLAIPKSTIISYQDLAILIGKPKSIRAAANAVAVNPIAYLIPCHRVIAKSGAIHNYRWGKERKKAMFVYEMADFGNIP
jgi:AraC family transcriptional regulator of adaptative response/methylated-DNA-[protein]-cysteine methyltransferase